MLPFFVFVAVQAGLADVFIAECANAVLGIKEGVWGMEGKDDAGKPYRIVLVRQGERERVTTTSGSTVVRDVETGPTSVLSVMPPDRKYFIAEYPHQAKARKPDPLPPLEEGEFQFNLMDGRGFVLRSNPGFSGAKVVKGQGLETLTAVARKPNGSEARVTLVRSAATRLPTTLRVVTPKGTTDIHLIFQSRKVSDAELTISPASYKDFEKIDPSSGAL